MGFQRKIHFSTNRHTYPNLVTTDSVNDLANCDEIVAPDIIEISYGYPLHKKAIFRHLSDCDDGFTRTELFEVIKDDLVEMVKYSFEIPDYPHTFYDPWLTHFHLHAVTYIGQSQTNTPRFDVILSRRGNQ